MFGWITRNPWTIVTIVVSVVACATGVGALVAGPTAVAAAVTAATGVAVTEGTVMVTAGIAVGAGVTGTLAGAKNLYDKEQQHNKQQSRSRNTNVTNGSGVKLDNDFAENAKTTSNAYVNDSLLQKKAKEQVHIHVDPRFNTQQAKIDVQGKRLDELETELKGTQPATQRAEAQSDQTHDTSEKSAPALSSAKKDPGLKPDEVKSSPKKQTDNQATSGISVTEAAVNQAVHEAIHSNVDPKLNQQTETLEQRDAKIREIENQRHAKKMEELRKKREKNNEKFRTKTEFHAQQLAANGIFKQTEEPNAENGNSGNPPTETPNNDSANTL
ncbi:MAG: hypothetical protein Tsb005_07750 [Gammaproteobacteria bacterium]